MGSGGVLGVWLADRREGAAPSLERLVSTANACYRIGDFSNATALANRVLQDVKKFVGQRPQSDDLTLVCFGVV